MLDNLGSPDESTFPYLPDDQQKDPTARLQFLTRAPGSAIEAAAKKHRIVSGFKVATKISAVRTSLDGGLPVLLSMKVFSSIGKVGHDGKLPMPTTADKFEGGHAVLCVGYNDQEQHLIIRNSWGADWADGGYFYMPYAYVKAGFVRSAVIPKL
jgi:C1A family cysteine protease